MEETRKKPITGIRIRTFNTVMIMLSTLIFVCLIFNTITLRKQYEDLGISTEEYITCEADATELLRASDYLTEQVRLYVANMDIVNMQNYFIEANETRRRDNALAELQQHDTPQYVQDSLESALKASNDLMVREIYAMKLISVANGYAEAALPPEVQAVQLKAEDALLTPDEMIAKARTMVFDTGYQDAKALINSHLSHFTEGLLSVMSQRQTDSETALGKALSLQRALIFILFIICIITYVVVTVLIVHPLSIHIKRIKENGLLKIAGSYEFKYLALTYNDIYELNAANQAALKDETIHDALTGLMNRRGFDNLQNILRTNSTPLALVVADVDTFKQINDRYGHDTGDRVLQRVASLLTSIFRSSDYVVRLGGDEFAVVIHGMGRENLSTLKEKLQTLNHALMNPDGDLPPASVSAGVAFSSNGFSDELYRQADQALYYVKEHGRCGYHVWEPDETQN